MIKLFIKNIKLRARILMLELELNKYKSLIDFDFWEESDL